MKSAYELAMERLNKTAPTVKLNARQKAELAELDALTKLKARYPNPRWLPDHSESAGALIGATGRAKP